MSSIIIETISAKAAVRITIAMIILFASLAKSSGAKASLACIIARLAYDVHSIIEIPIQTNTGVGQEHPVLSCFIARQAISECGLTFLANILACYTVLDPTTIIEKSIIARAVRTSDRSVR